MVAGTHVDEYRYRKLFKLSKREFREEPYEDYVWNMMIDTIIIQSRNSKLEKTKNGTSKR